MQNMIKKIIDVDRKAKETVEQAKKERANIEKKLDDAKKIIEEDYLRRAQSAVEAMRVQRQEKLEDDEKKIKAEFDEKKKILEERFDIYCESWVSAIVERALDSD